MSRRWYHGLVRGPRIGRGQFVGPGGQRIEAGAQVGGVAGRPVIVTIGAAGFVLMGAGLLLLEPFQILWLGIPIFLVGLLLLVKAIF